MQVLIKGLKYRETASRLFILAAKENGPHPIDFEMAEDSLETISKLEKEHPFQCIECGAALSRQTHICPVNGKEVEIPFGH